MKKENTIIALLLLILLVLAYQTYQLKALSSKPVPEHQDAAGEEKKPSPKENGVNPYADANLKTEVFMNEDKTFGYLILLNGSPMIRQPNIPGLPGNAGFQDAQKAEKTAGLVLLKIRKNIMPPAVTSEELDSLGVL